MKKHSKHELRVISFEKDMFWSSNLNNHTNYIILVPQHFFQFHFDKKKVYFCYFLVPG
jgi:hypothetical protein